MVEKAAKLKRARQPMPSFVRDALRDANLMEKYLERPAYQQNDYLLWINKAKKDATKQKRLAQMLNELNAGGVYMNMKHAPSARND
ncbi:YdeI/OmpD-associated family protein [Thiosocius teredinicola]|uniref:YdeI/OmpD-associated family protein n=1 Tax=Thiosocius teredinicola TaxID=1973002 RepID=UPI00099137DC